MEKGLKVLFGVWIIWLLLELTQILGLHISKSGLGVYAILYLIYFPFQMVFPVWGMYILGFLAFWFIGKGIYSLESEKKWPKIVTVIASVLLIIQPLITLFRYYIQFSFYSKPNIIGQLGHFLLGEPIALAGCILGVITLFYIYNSSKQ